MYIFNPLHKKISIEKSWDLWGGGIGFSFCNIKMFPYNIKKCWKFFKTMLQGILKIDQMLQYQCFLKIKSVTKKSLVFLKNLAVSLFC